MGRTAATISTMKIINSCVFSMELCLVLTGLDELPLNLLVSDDYVDVIYHISYSQ